MPPKSKEKDLNNFHVDTAERILKYLEVEERFRFYDLNTNFSEACFSTLIEVLDDSWLKPDMKEFTKPLNNYSQYIKTLNLSLMKSYEFHEYLFIRCPNIRSITLETDDLNHSMELIYDYFNRTLKSLSLTSIVDSKESKPLSQIPLFLSLECLRLTCMKVDSSKLNDILFFVAPEIKKFSLGTLNRVDKKTMELFFEKLTNLDSLELHANEFTESALFALDRPLPYLRELTIGEIRNLTNLSENFCFKTINLKSMLKMRIFGPEDSPSKYPTITHLFGDIEYPFTFLTMNYLDLTVAYDFTNTRFKNLRSLDLDSCSGLDEDHIFNIFTRMPTLKKLTMNNCPITDEHFVNLNRRDRTGPYKPCRIKILSIREIGEIGDEFFYFLITSMHNLNHFDISHTKLSGMMDISDTNKNILAHSKLRSIPLQSFRFRESFLPYELVETFLITMPNLQLLETDDVLMAKKLLEYRDTYGRTLSVYQDLARGIEL